MSFPVVAPDWSVYSGDAFAQTYQIQLGGVVTDLRAWTGWVAAWRPYQGAEVIVLSVATGSLLTGTITVNATDAQTRLMDGPGMWDVQSSQGGSTRTWLRGKTQFVEDIAL